MDDVDSPLRPRRPRAKNSFQQEIESKLKERRAKGLTADITSEESEEDTASDLMFTTGRHQNRPSSAKRRGDHGSTWQPGLGDTLRTQDIDKLMGRRTPTSFEEDEDAEVASTLREKPSSGFGLSQRKTPTPKDGLLGRKTPTSPLAQELSKEDIIFGRKTPTQSQLRGKSPQGGSDLPNLGGQQPWQPPSFRNVSPSSEQQRHSPGSQGRRTPGLDSGLDPISEKQERSQRLPYDKRGSPGLSDDSPRSDRPTPRARGRTGGEKEQARPARTTPTLDLFGKSRHDSAMEVAAELKDIDDKKAVEDRIQRRRLERKSPGFDRNTPVLDRKPSTDRKSPGPERKPSTDRKSPGMEGRFSGGRKSPGPGNREDARERNRLYGRKSPGQEQLQQDEDRPRKKDDSPSLLAFLTGETDDKPRLNKNKDKDKELSKAQPKPRERPSRRSNKIPKDEHKEIYDIGEVPQPSPRRTQKFADDSSLCEELKEDPFAPLRKVDDQGDGRKPPKQRSDRQQADDAILKVEEEQNRIDFKPVKKVRPVSAQAKVQHRPKPRYGALPGQTSKEATMPEFNSTMDIREAVYEEWYRKRMKTAQAERKEKQRKEEEEAKKKKQEKEEKQQEAMLSYKAWEEKKKERIAKEKARQKKEEEKKKEKEIQEREDKRVEAEVTFKSWKEKKDVVIKNKTAQQKRSEREKKDKEEEEKESKEKYNQSAYKGWKSRKDEELKQKAREVKKNKAEEETNLLATQKQKEDEAQRRYEEWMYNKEKQDNRKKIERQRKMMTEVDFRPAWSPANHTVPFGR